MKNLVDKDIREILPHRDPFLFVDKVITVELGSVTAVRHINKEEVYFKGHFPGNPLMPGVLIVESMAQVSGIACSAYCKEKGDDSQKEQQHYFLSRVSDIKFKHPVFPGEDLIITAKVLDHFDSSFKVHVVSEVNGKSVAEGEIVLTRQGG